MILVLYSKVMCIYFWWRRAYGWRTGVYMIVGRETLNGVESTNRIRCKKTLHPSENMLSTRLDHSSRTASYRRRWQQQQANACRFGCWEWWFNYNQNKHAIWMDDLIIWLLYFVLYICIPTTYDILLQRYYFLDRRAVVGLIGAHTAQHTYMLPHSG